jgi:predicted transcriptional regulator
MKLQKAGVIKTRVSGSRKRFYLVEVPVPVENGGEMHHVQQRILSAVREQPGAPVNLLAETLGLSRQLVLYHLRKLSQSGLVDLHRQGLQLQATLREGEGGLGLG